ncbi:MAG: hypothetical protein WAT74_15790 [Flavobacteriales bacterium]
MDALDILGQVLFVLALVAPLLMIGVVWRRLRMHWAMRLVVGLVFGVMLSAILWNIGLLLCFRDGMGP